MLLTKEVEIVLHPSNIKYYESLGYEIPRRRKNNHVSKNDLRVPRGTKIIVKIEDLLKGSQTKVMVECDYCGKEHPVFYKNYLNSRLGAINKDCCINCLPKKVKESNLINYGVISTNDLEFVKNKKIQTTLNNYGVTNALMSPIIQEKSKQTLLNKYGVEHYSKTDEFKEKCKETCLERYGFEFSHQNEEIVNKMKETNIKRYGFENVFQNEEIKNKSKQTSLSKYGVEYYTQTDEFKEKVINTCQERYGVDNPMQNDLIKNKSINTMFLNGTQKCSIQQKFLHNLLGGELNYPIGILSLDITFPKENLYIEYDGGGHKLNVVLNSMSSEDFKTKEIKRTYYLKSKGWKQIKIISIKDLLPSDEIILQLINQAKEYLNTGHSWFEINIDERKLKCRQYEIDYDYGQLRKIKDKDIENQEADNASFLLSEIKVK
jgi:hypothetical protein